MMMQGFYTKTRFSFYQQDFHNATGACLNEQQ